jgi:hypothetical protein
LITIEKPRTVRFNWYDTQGDQAFLAVCNLAAEGFLTVSQTSYAAMRLEAVRLILAALAAGGPSGLPVSIAREESKVDIPSIPSSTEPTMVWLIKTGWVDQIYLTNGNGSHSDFLAHQGRMKYAKKGRAASGGYLLTAKAWAALQGIRPEQWRIPDDRVITVKNAKKRPIQPPAHPRLDEWRNQLVRHNGALHQWRFTLDDENVPSAYFQLTRVFNSADYSKGGRFYCGFQNEASIKRARLLIDGKPVVSIDCKNLHGRLSLAASGVVCPRGDLYDFQGIDRKLVKKAWAAALNADNRTGFTWGDDDDFDDDTKDKEERARVLKEIVKRHPSLTSLFGRGVGLMMQRADSEMVGILLDGFQAANRPIVPIHDGFLLLAEDEALFNRIYPEAIKALHSALRIHWPDLVEADLPIEIKTAVP